MANSVQITFFICLTFIILSLINKIGELSKSEKVDLKTLKEFKEIQGRQGTIDQGDYMVGLYNGIELAIATIENREPEYKDCN